MMKQKLRRLGWALGTALVMGCQELPLSTAPTTSTTPIQAVQKFPAGRKVKPVTLSGRVVRQAPFAKGGAYLLEDETGQIWVRTKRKLPNPGEEIVIQGGQEQRQIELGGRDVGEVYVQELERR